ncbi:MAG: GTPase HflX [Oscillospiraceae bacterium]|nr:GTPase HflX [Oscillospiraceae bacterium]
MTEIINETQDKAILISIATPDISESECIISLDELERLADTAGISPAARLYQNRTSPEPATYIGKGKLEEAKSIIHANDINIAIIDGELSPSQIKNIEDFLDIEVIDRTMLILEIFGQHAHTSEGKLQVDIAQLRYTLPRLTGKGKAMSRIGGGGVGGGGTGGTGGAVGGVGGARRGAGETKLEIERRTIKSNIAVLEKELKQLEISRGVMRSRREKTGIPNIAIAGYTNSGKSTLLNYLTNAGILAENKLFATLDPTTRRLKLPNSSEVLLTDTVGLIRKLPHHLVRAFKSTLDEINYADIILLVSDISDPEHQNQLEVAKSLLIEMGITDRPIIAVYNKIDMAQTSSDSNERDVEDAVPYVGAENDADVYISAKTGDGIGDLLQKIQEVLESQRKSVIFAFPVRELNGKEQGYISYLYKNASVSDIEYGEEFTTVRAVVDIKTKNMYEKYLTR